MKTKRLDGGEDCETPYYQCEGLSKDGYEYGIIIEMFLVPSVVRGTGIGKNMYQQFEDKLPENIKIVNLIAADLGSGDTQGFWFERGFRKVFEDQNKKNKQFYIYMQKGINGYLTPPTLPRSSYVEGFFSEMNECMKPKQFLNEEKDEVNKNSMSLGEKKIRPR
jgi:hypothetical protein